MHRVVTRAGAAVLTLFVGCSATEERPRPGATGSLQGIVRLRDGSETSATIITNTTDPEVCGESQTLRDAEVGADGGVANVIVSLTGVAKSGAPETMPTTLVLDNRGCQFQPHAAVMTAGSTLEATNDDAVLHTTHLYGPTEMNFSLPVRGTSQRRPLSRPGLYVVKCDIHGWMQAFIRVDDHPFHAVTDEDGRFSIAKVPSGGPYTLEVWHEKLGELDRQITVEPGKTTRVELEYSPPEPR